MIKKTTPPPSLFLIYLKNKMRGGVLVLYEDFEGKHQKVFKIKPLKLSKSLSMEKGAD